jgi:predicted TPR repeat methyltransferase
VQHSFDERAATWDDDPAKVERSQRVASAIRELVPLGPEVRLLEYGAGTGLVTEALRDAVGPSTLADTSAGMRAVMERKVAGGTLRDARIWDLDLSTAAAPAETFDLIVTVLTLHHIPELSPVMAAFASLLDGDGHLCIVDLEEEDGSFHGDAFEGHRGFRRADMEKLLTDAGFTGVDFHPCGELDRNGSMYPLFLAVARLSGS